MAGNYSEEYRHFDSLIWQVPAWSTAIFLITVIGLNSLSQNSSLIVKEIGLSRKTIFTFFFGFMGLLILILSHVLYRFRVYQEKLKGLQLFPINFILYSMLHQSSSLSMKLMH